MDTFDYSELATFLKRYNWERIPKYWRVAGEYAVRSALQPRDQIELWTKDDKYILVHRERDLGTVFIPTTKVRLTTYITK